MNLSNKTFLPTYNYKNCNWFVIDCKDQKLGRLATRVAALLKGKVKPYYYPSVDLGDQIILINANSIILNENTKHFFVHKPGRPGSSLKVRKASECLTQVIIEKAIKGMLSKTETKRLMGRLKIYNSTEHPHMAQHPTKLNISSFYSKSQLKLKY